MLDKSIVHRIEHCLRLEGYCAIRNLIDLSANELIELGRLIGTVITPLDNMIIGSDSLIDSVQVACSEDVHNTPAGARYHHEDACCVEFPDIVMIYCVEAKGAEVTLINCRLNDEQVLQLRNIVVTNSSENYKTGLFEDVMAVASPAVKTSKVTGWQTLNSCEVFTTEINCIQNSSVKLIYQKIINAQNRRFTHTWKAGDLIVFDNASFLHKGNTLKRGDKKSLMKVHISLV